MLLFDMLRYFVYDLCDLTRRERILRDEKHASIVFLAKIGEKVQIVCQYEPVTRQGVLGDAVIIRALPQFWHKINVNRIMPIVLQAIHYPVVDVLVCQDPERHSRSLGPVIARPRYASM